MSATGRGSAETIASGSGRVPRRWPTALLVSAVVVAFGGALADRTVRAHEVDVLLDHAESASAAVVLADERVRAMQEYVRPVAASSGSSTELGADLDELVRRAGAEGSAEVASQQARVDGSAVLPWHDDVQLARDRLGDYFAARAALLAVTGSEDWADRRIDSDVARSEAVTALQAIATSPEQESRVESALGQAPP